MFFTLPKSTWHPSWWETGLILMAGQASKEEQNYADELINHVIESKTHRIIILSWRWKHQSAWAANMDVPVAHTLQARTAMLIVARCLTCFIKSMLWESFFLAYFLLWRAGPHSVSFHMWYNSERIISRLNLKWVMCGVPGHPSLQGWRPLSALILCSKTRLN